MDYLTLAEDIEILHFKIFFFFFLIWLEFEMQEFSHPFSMSCKCRKPPNSLYAHDSRVLSTPCDIRRDLRLIRISFLTIYLLLLHPLS